GSDRRPAPARRPRHRGRRQALRPSPAARRPDGHGQRRRPRRRGGPRPRRPRPRAGGVDLHGLRDAARGGRGRPGRRRPRSRRDAPRHHAGGGAVSAFAAPAPRAPRDDYTDFCEAVRRLCSIDLLQYKRGQMERRIRTFVTTRGHGALVQYASVLRRDRQELDRFLDRVTINVSQLWRHPEQFEVLSRVVLPELAQAGRIRAWSAGSSYGAEAYTLAAVAKSAVPRANVTITGTDIDGRMVE